MPPFRLPVLTAPVLGGIPPRIDDDPLLPPKGAPQSPQSPQPSTLRDDAPIALAGRLELGDVLPDTTRLALALEGATRALQSGKAEAVLAELDAVWSHQLASDSPWYLRGGALQLLGRTADAEQVLRDAVARLPRSAAILYLLGVHTAHRGQPEAARLANDHALALHPTEPLLWLQRAALATREGTPDMATAILQHVRTLAPAFPADDWLTMLARLGEPLARTPTPTYQKAIARLTPSSLPAVESNEAAPATIAAAQIPPNASASALDAAVRYGLTLLEAPTHSARTATGVSRASGSSDAVSQLGAIIRGIESQPLQRAELPAWDTITLAICVVVIALVPSLRIPALMLGGAATMLLVARRLR